MSASKEGYIMDSSSLQATIREELHNMPFEEVQQMKEKLGAKMINSALFGNERQTKRNFETKRNFVQQENKNGPREISSKIPVSVIRSSFATKKHVSRDPRFDDLSGTFNEHAFKSSYSFVDDIKAKEKKALERQFKKEDDPETKQKIKSVLQGMATKEKLEKSKETERERDKQWRHQQLNKIKEGKNPYFLKKSDKKKMDLAEKFQVLKKSGKLKQYLANKRKKNATKERIELSKERIELSKH